MEETMSVALDYSVEGVNERMNKVSDIIDKNDGLLVNYYDNYFNAKLNQNSRLSENDPMTKRLETLADYILYEDEKKQKEKNKEKGKKKANSLISEHGKTRNKQREILSDDMVMIEQMQQQRAIKEYKKVKVSKEDREMHPELNASGETIDKITEQIKSGVDSKGNKLSIDDIKMLKWIRTDIRKDEVVMKEHLKRIIRFKNIAPDAIDESMFGHFRFDDTDCIKVIMNYYSDLVQNSWDNTNGYIRVILQSFEELVEKTNLTPLFYDLFVLKIDKEPIEFIIESLEETHGDALSVKQVSHIWTNVLPKLIVATYQQQKEDWVYTNALKGDYKTCSKCGENKLALPKYFSKDKSKKDGFKYQCKSCEKSGKSK